MKNLMLVLLLLGVSSTVLAELDPQKAAKIAADREAALADVQKKYGNKKPSELSNDERRAMMKEQSDAESKVLNDNGVNAKEWSRYEATQSREDRAATEKAKAELKKKSSAPTGDQAAPADGEVEVQRGFGNGAEDSSGSAKGKGGSKKKKK